MTVEDSRGFARQVADLNTYGQALNQCRSVDEVVSLTLEAVTILFEFADATVVEVREGEPRIAGSTSADRSIGDEPGEIAGEAIASAETVTRCGGDAGPDGGSGDGAWLAVPASIVDDVVAVIVVRSRSGAAFDDEQVRPLEILATHGATAISNIRSHERLERARQDLERRKEMIEMYDRLLRHDIGNDLQVVTAFAAELADSVEDDRAVEYAEKIERAAHNSADLVHRVGDLVSTLQSEREPAPRDLRPIVEETADTVESQYDPLAVELDSSAFDYRVYAGDLLDSVFTNVLSNAAVHNDGPVTVDVTAVEPTPGTVAVRLADDGRGVPPDLHDEIFEMGAKGNASEGTGFGLGFVRALTESYGGSVAVDESDAGGAEFRVRLERA